MVLSQVTHSGSRGSSLAAQAEKTPRRKQAGTDFSIYTPAKHPLYDGKFRITCGKIYQVGSLSDKPGWDHIDNAGSTVHPVEGTVEIDVDEINNTGTVVTRLRLPEGDLVIEYDRFHEFNPCQDGGLASMIFEHGDSGCGDANYPKTLLYLAGWGYGHATLDGKPLYKDYQVHFMVTQGMRDRETLATHYPMIGKRSPAGEVNPAQMQMDFYIRSPELDNRNNPTRKVFDHFYCTEITWK